MLEVAAAAAEQAEQNNSPEAQLALHVIVLHCHVDNITLTSYHI